MLTKCPPFRSAHNKDPYFRRLSSPDKKAFWKIFSQLDLNDMMRELFERMTDKDPDSRFTIEQIKAHQWINDTQYDDDSLIKELEIRGEIVQASMSALEERNNLNSKQSQATSSSDEEGASASHQNEETYRDRVIEFEELERLRIKLVEKVNEINARLQRNIK